MQSTVYQEKPVPETAPRGTKPSTEAPGAKRVASSVLLRQGAQAIVDEKASENHRRCPVPVAEKAA